MRATRLLLGFGPFLAVAASSRLARADQPPPVDVVIKQTPPPRRLLTIEWNPLPLITIGRLSANVVVALPKLDHHAIIVSPYYAWTTTNRIYIYDDAGNQTALPTQHFEGGGAELGYRYYSGYGGARGLFLGPSLILAAFQARAQDNATLTYANFGLAADVGYEALLADRVALSLGGGLQYTATSKSIPDQQFPAELYANGGLRPRVLLSIGWAL